MGRLFRILTATIIISAVGIGLSHAETIWEKRQKALKGIEEQQNEAVKEEKQVYTEEKSNIEIPEEIPSGSIDLATITIPDQYGSIIEMHNGTNGKLIVHIQDAHANYEAQINNANILESLINDYGLKLILREGENIDDNYDYLKEEVSLEGRKAAAEKLLRDAKMSGEAYLNLTTDYQMSFQGLEDKALYDENIDALWEMDKFKGAALEYVSKMSAAADDLKAKIYNEALIVIDKAKKDYDNETIDLVAYYEALNKAASDKNIPLDKFPNFSSVVKINEMEKKIDLAKINDGTATEEQKTIYKEYRDLLANLNVNKLFKEEPLVEKAIHEALFENEDQKKLYNISKAASILDKMLKVKTVPEEYDYFLKNKGGFNPQGWVNFLKQKSMELGIDVKMPENYYIISDNLAKIQNFYDLAGKRDEVFVRKTNERMEKDNIQIAALIAGGFHTPQLTRLLADKGYSYIVISPKVTTHTNEELYRSVLKKY